MHECFERVKEPRTNTDIVEDVIFNRCSDLRRLNFKGFYTVILEKGDEIISAATIRVFGEKVAEVPLVGTAFRFRRLGMCRVLMDELEKKLRELGVEMLVLPAIESVLDTWTGRFGFSKMTEPERLNLLDYTFLYFQDTTMCRKLLLSGSELIVAEEQNNDVISGNELMNLENNENIPEELPALQVLESGNIEESSLGAVIENEIMAVESTGNVPDESLALQIHESGNVEEKTLGAVDGTNNTDSDSTNNDHIIEEASIEYPPLETDVNDNQYERDEHGSFKRCKR
jgi:N-acetylglutamate synthase-like GNAT family acetyltransferase